MTAYLLDTNIISYLFDPASPNNAAIRRKWAALDAGSEVLVSVVSIYEASYAAARDPAFGAALARIRAEFDVAALPEEGATHFARLKLAMAKAWGAKPGALARHNVDLILAATALASGMTIVSNDQVFATLASLDPALQWENWTV